MPVPFPSFHDRPAFLLLLGFALVVGAFALPAGASDDARVVPLSSGQAAPAGTEAGDPTESFGGLCSESATGPLATGVKALDRPNPFPQYCDDCRPCSVQGQCGYDSGYYLGVCSPNPSYCGHPGYAACVCY